ncbi:MAG TPA: aminoglycoside phosphotransferase family protein [Holophagaceae bacterium]|nr:aminoglycoside phosphotransferase family protein [Holophagaceae bacterium]
MPAATTVPAEILAAYGLRGPGIEPLGQGRINDTFRVGDVVVQRLNGEVFPAGEAVLANLERVLAHLGGKGATPLRLLPTVGGALSARDGAGDLWRAFNFLPGTRTVEGRATPAEAEAAARGFGAYLRALADLPVVALKVVIPGFHDTPARLAAFEAARRRDPLGRAATLGPLDSLLARLRPHAGDLVDPSVPIRIAHDDTKLNNVLLDAATGRAICVLDLDTTQPGSWLADFGDMARSACNPGGEEAAGGRDLAPDLDTFDALARGFLAELGPLLTPAERQRLAVAPAVIAFELGLRFLTDHLEGDSTFRVARPGDNLRRAEVQWALAAGFLEATPRLQAIVEGALRG